MKKKLISLLLALVVVIGLTAIGVAAEEATPAGHTDHCVCGGNGDGRGDHVCAESGMITDWQPFSVDVCETMADGRLIIPTGNYYLADNLTTDKAFVILPDTEVTICLNGKTLESTARVFRVHGILNISECTNGTGKVIGANGGQAPVFYIGAKGHINHYRGILRAKQDTKNYGGVGAVANDALTGYVEERASGSMIMYGGNLDASKVTLTTDSDSKYGYGGALVIFGSTAAPCSFTQYGGTIMGAKSVETNGAAIYTHSTATVQILGGVVESGTAKNLGDGIYCVEGCALTVGGSAKIEDLYVPGSQTFTTQNLTGSVGLSTPVTNSAVLTTVATADEAAKFTSNVTGRSVIATEVEGAYQISLGHAAHCVCGGNLTGVAAENHSCNETLPTWTPLTAAIMDDVYNNSNIPENNILGVSKEDEDGKGSGSFNRFLDDYDTGHYYLTENISMSYPIDIHTNDDITICLNGYTLSCTNGTNPTFRVWGKLTICDCIGEGHLTGKAKGGSSNGYGAVICMRNDNADTTNGTVVNIYGGTIEAKDNNDTERAGIIAVGHSSSVNSPAVLNIYGGTITGGKATDGGNIYMGYNANATLNMYGGTISGGTATTNGGNIYCSSGTVNIYDGTITGGTAGGQGGNIYLSNADNASGRVCVFNMYSGSITDGAAATRGGNIYFNQGTCIIHTGEITGGTLTDYQRGLDIGVGAATANSNLTLNGEVTIGEIGVQGNNNEKYAIILGENFTTQTPIRLYAANLSKVIANTDASMLASFTPVNENAQLTYESGDIWMRSADEHYTCFCGNVYLTDGSTISHTCSMTSKWVAVDQAFLESSATTTETVTTTDETTGETTTEEVTTVTGWGSPVTNTNATLGGTYYEIPSGYYYLTEDITLEHGLRVTSGKDVRIDLNGHTITAPSDNARALFMQGNLRICDSSYDPTKENKAEQFQGAIVATRASNYSLAYVSGSGALRIYGGNYYSSADCSANTNAMIGATGEVYIFDGYFEAADMNGTGALVNLQVSGNNKGLLAIRKATLVGAKAKNGGIIGSTAEGTTINIYSGNLIGSEVSGYGGAVYTTKGSVTIKGGTISGGEATGEGGNIYAESLTMTGGTVTGGTSASYGGNIYITGESTISGGTVEKGISTSTSRSGGNICVTGGELTISGDAVISGGVANEGGNMSVRQKGTINITGGTIENGEAQKHGGNISVYANLNVSGGLIQNGKAVTRGGNISGFANTCNINITGGEIKNGIVVGDGETAAADLYGANITVLSDDDNVPIYLTITGGTIGGLGEGCVEGITSVHVQSSGMEIITTVGGTAVIDELRLGTARMLTIAEGGFSEGASIGITRFELTGVFAPNAAADYSAYFHGTKEGTSVEAVATETGYDMVLVSSIPYWAFDADNNPVGPAKTIAEAMGLEGATFVRLVSDYTTDEVVEGDLHLDLYGYDLTGLTVNGKLYAVDYKGHDYEEGVLGKLISFTGTVQNVYTSDREVHSGVRTYVALVNEDGSYSFHRVSVSITHVSLDPANDALGYKATISGDSQVLAAVTGFGFNMGVEGGVTKTYTLDGAPTDGVFTLRLKNIMAANGGEMTVIGQPIVIFGEDTVTGSNYSTSMKKTIQSVNGMETLTDAQKTAVYGLYEKYSETMAAWLETNNIANWKPAEAETPAA